MEGDINGQQGNLCGGGKRHWTVNYANTQSFINTFFPLIFKNLGHFYKNLDWVRSDKIFNQ